MFTGIIEALGLVKQVLPEGDNIHFIVSSSFAADLKVDQSVSHNGICLTVVSVDHANQTYMVTAIKETLSRTNLKHLREGDAINLERGMLANARLDGHIVQGHIDGTAICVQIEKNEGSWKVVFENDGTYRNLIVEKGSVTVNGVSLTVVDVSDFTFSVALIPYTIAHTTFQFMQTGDKVNVEFDIIGKYVARLIKPYHV